MSNTRKKAWMADRMLAVARQDPQLQERWLPASDFFEAVAEDEYPDGDEAKKEADKFTFKNFVKCVNNKHKETMRNFDGQHNGLLMYFFSVPRQPSIFYYYVTQPGTEVIKPEQGKVTTFPSIRPVPLLPQKRSAPESTTDDSLPSNPQDGENTSNAASNDMPVEAPPGKKTKRVDNRKSFKDTPVEPDVETPPGKKTRWDWYEFKELFRPRKNETVKECLYRRIDLLAHVNRKEKNWMDIIDNRDEAEQCTTNYVFHLRHKCALLAKTYERVLKHMGDGADFRTCCKKAIESYSSTSYNDVQFPGTIAIWNRSFESTRNFLLKAINGILCEQRHRKKTTDGVTTIALASNSRARTCLTTYRS